MENNGFIVKGLAIILIIILGLNVYRTETTRKEMDRLAEVVGGLEVRLDTLDLGSCSVENSAVATEITKKQFTNLSKTVSNLESRVSALDGKVNQLTKNASQSSAKAVNAGTVASTASGSLTAAPSTPLTDVGRVTVSSKVKVEDRYVEGSVVLPKVSTGPAGTVVVGITIGWSGHVGSAKTKSGTTITDEDILDACKEAALKTRFSVNTAVSDKHPGTITYTFERK